MIDLTVKAFAHNLFELLTCNKYFHTRKRDPLIFGQTLIFLKVFTLQINRSTNPEVCVEQTSISSPTTTIANKLFICVPQHQGLLEKRDANYKNKDNMAKYRQSARLGSASNCPTVVQFQLSYEKVKLSLDQS